MNQVHLISIVVSLDNSGPSSPDYWNVASTIRFYYASKLYYSYTCETYANCENTWLASWGTHQRTIYRLIHMIKTRSGHRKLLTIVKPDSESHFRQWWRDQSRIRNGCTEHFSRRWYLSSHAFLLASHWAFFRNHASPTSEWQLPSASHSTSQSLSGPSARTCTKSGWFQIVCSNPASSSLCTWMAISATMDLMTQHSASRTSTCHGGAACILRLAIHHTSVQQQSSWHSITIIDNWQPPSFQLGHPTEFTTFPTNSTSQLTHGIPQ